MQKEKFSNKSVVVSIIIPLYNQGPYVSQCIKSITRQTLKDIEIICIDDCSTDGSLEILQCLAANDHRIKILKMTKNAGSGEARNKGLEYASGVYVGFVDPDDYYPHNKVLEGLFSRIQLGDYDLAGGNVLSYDNRKSRLGYPRRFIRFGNDKNVYYPSARYYHRFIYRKEYLGKTLSFPPYRRGQDVVFLARVMSNHPKIITTDMDVYVHRKYHKNAMQAELILRHALASYRDSLNILSIDTMVITYRDEYDHFVRATDYMIAYFIVHNLFSCKNVLFQWNQVACSIDFQKIKSYERVDSLWKIRIYLLSMIVKRIFVSRYQKKIIRPIKRIPVIGSILVYAKRKIFK